MDDIKDLSVEESSKTIIKEKKHRTIQYYLLAFAIPVICMIIHMVLTECYPFGENTVLRGDANSQFLGFFREWLEQIEDGGSFFFDWNGGMGYDFFTTYWYYLASPFNWIILLFGQEYLELGMVTVLLLQIGACGVTSCYYFMHSKINKMEKGVLNNLLCVLFSLAFSMCDYILAYQYCMIWLISFMLIPLVLLGVERLVENKDGRLYGIILFLVLVTNFYFAWFVCLFAVIWFIDQRKENIKSGLKSFAHFAGISILSAICAAAILIPCYLLVLGREDNWVSISDYGLNTFGNIGDFFQGFFLSCEVDMDGSTLFTNNNYCGIFVLFLLIIYVFVKNIKITQKLKRIIEIVLLAFSMNWIGMIYVLHGFSIPHAFTNRFAIILVTIMIITAFEALQYISTVRIRYIGISLFIFVAIFVCALILSDNVQNIVCYLGTIMIFVYLSICLFLLKRKSITQISFFVNVLIIGSVELIVNALIVSENGYASSMEKNIYAEEWSDDYQNIETSDGERKTTWMMDQNAFQYSDTNVFSSVINSNLLWLFDSLGLMYQNNGGSYAYKGTTPLTTALFNVDYVLTDEKAYYGGYESEQSYEFETIDDDYGLFKTAYDSSLGFMVSKDILNWDTNDENPFEVQNNFTRDVLKQGDIFTEINFDDLDVTYQNCIITDSGENNYSYMNIETTGYYYAMLKLTFTVPEDMELYIYTHDDYSNVIQVDIDGERYLGITNVYFASGTMVYLGELKAGQEVTVYTYNGTTFLDESTTYVYFYSYNDEVMQDCLDIMNETPLILDTFEDAYVSGTVTAEEDGVLYTSIPYYRGWILYVDGEKTDITKIADALVGVELTAGEHTIELKYFPYGLKLGIIISLIGIAGMIAYFICYRRKLIKL